MGQAKLKKLQLEKARVQSRQIDHKLLARAVRQVVGSSTGFHGADCLLYAIIGARALRELGIPAEPVAGSAVWRVGPGDSDVISHAREVSGAVFAQAGVPQAMQFHAWVEAPGQLIDFSTHTLHEKAAQLDAADGGQTSVNWAPDFIWIDQAAQYGRCNTPREVVKAPSEGQFCYVRHADIEAKAFKAEHVSGVEGSVAATMTIYAGLLRGEEMRVISVDPEGALQVEPESQQLVRWSPRGG